MKLREIAGPPALPGLFVVVQGGIWEVRVVRIDGAGNLDLGPRPHRAEWRFEVDGDRAGADALVAEKNAGREAA